MAGRLDGRVALITGAGSGIGAATARRFAQEGACVVVVDINEPAARSVVGEIESKGGRAVAFRADVAEPEYAAAMIRHTVATFGRLDVLHNNATSGEMGFLADMTVDAWNRTIAVNLTAPFLATKFALPVMMEQGGGVIVNTASPVALSAEPGLAAYAAAKAGVISLTRSTAIEHGRHRIRANCIVPGAIATPPTLAIATAVEGARERMLRANPFRRFGAPQEVANLVLFLASDEASFINGATYLVDGGAMASHNIGLVAAD